MVKALGNSSCTRAMVISGSCGVGNVAGIPPKREPIVSMGRPKAAVTTAPPTTATRKPGILGA